MRIKSLTAAAATALLLSTGLAHADGTHGVKIEITSDVNQKIEIAAYNAKDQSLSIPHKVYYVNTGGTRTVKCHGQGKGFCHVAIKINGTTKYLYWSELDDNSKCTISNNAGTFGWLAEQEPVDKKSAANLTCE